MSCTADCVVWYTVRSVAQDTQTLQHLVITITTIPESDIYLFIYMIYFTVQIHREHNLLALNLRLKYEIQVPNIGGYALGPPTKLLGVQAPYSTPMSY